MRKRIQKSMMFILIAILVPIYLIMSVGVYQRNLKILEGEIKQEASYIKRQSICQEQSILHSWMMWIRERG